MSSFDRTISGDALVHHLPIDALSIDLSLVSQHGRSARTLVKQGPLRLTLMELAPGGHLPTHSSTGPVSIHVLKGRVTISALNADYTLSAGDVLVLAGDVEHSALSDGGALFLLSLVHLE